LRGGMAAQSEPLCICSSGIGLSVVAAHSRCLLGLDVEERLFVAHHGKSRGKLDGAKIR
jgi:hypothetical protein